MKETAGVMYRRSSWVGLSSSHHSWRYQVDKHLEYCKTMKVMEKSDLYLFGMFMLEVICGRASVEKSNVLKIRMLIEPQNLPIHNLRVQHQSYRFISILAKWVRECIEKGRLDDEMIDPFFVGQIGDNCLKKFRETAFEYCLCDEGIQWPTIADVVGRLEFSLELQENALTLSTN